MHQTKMWTTTDKSGFSSAMFRSRLEQKKTPATESLVRSFVFCFLCVICVKDG